ncbi:MAG: hypothetical protein AAGK71_14185, partial [Pseudomonadota bacterium]
MTVLSRLTVSARLLAISALMACSAPALHAESDAPDYVVDQFGEPPAMPDGPLSAEVEAAVKVAFVDSVANSAWGPDQNVALETIAASQDPRIVWAISDLMRFASGPGLSTSLSEAAATLLKIDPPRQNQWGVITDHLIAWDVPAPPGYLAVKRGIFTRMVPGWDPLFVDGEIDWRHVSWGGVLIDDRP